MAAPLLVLIVLFSLPAIAGWSVFWAVLALMAGILATGLALALLGVCAHFGLLQPVEQHNDPDSRP